MMRSVAELHREHPYDKDKKSWGYSIGFEDAIAIAGELHEQIDPVGYLDKLLDSDLSKARAISRALLFLPADVVLDNFGHEVAAWVSANTSIMGDNDEINKALESRAGYNLSDLETSRSWRWNNHYDSKGRPILANYQLMQDVKDGALSDIDLEKLLTTNTRPGGRVDGWFNDVSETVSYSMWLDAPIGYALTYKGLPNAMAGIAMRSVDELMLHQIQGVRGDRLDPDVSQYSRERKVGKNKSRGLVPLDWQGLLVAAAESLGQNLGVRQLGIQAGKNNLWVKSHGNNEEAHITLAEAERTYDATAQRLGFTAAPGDTQGNWYTTIEQ